MHDVGVYNLRTAIILNAIKEYETAINNKDKLEMRNLEKWFFSEWYKYLSGGIDGQKVIDVCRLRVKYKNWRKNKGCFKCSKMTCIHRSGEHFTTMEKDNMHCLKEGGLK
jgi:hypothetical protein